MREIEQRESLLTGTTVVIACGGEHDVARHVAASADLGAHHVVVDLGDADMVDSATLTALKRVAERLRSYDGRLSVIYEHLRLDAFLDLILLNRSFHVFDSLDAALRPRP